MFEKDKASKHDLNRWGTSNTKLDWSKKHWLLSPPQNNRLIDLYKEKKKRTLEASIEIFNIQMAKQTHTAPSKQDEALTVLTLLLPLLFFSLKLKRLVSRIWCKVLPSYGCLGGFRRIRRSLIMIPPSDTSHNKLAKLSPNDTYRASRAIVR